jgi:ABC-type dipeptide/oligopeptide/nickel transport system permease component
MYRYIVKRLLLAIPTLVGAAALVFILMRLIPGDICVIRMGAGGSHVDAAAVALCHRQLGLDNPLYVQFLDSCGATSLSISAIPCGRATPYRRRSYCACRSRSRSPSWRR